MVFVRSPFNYDADEVSRETGTDCSVEESMTQQSFKEECDINTIVKRFGVTGMMPQNVVPPTYQTFTGVIDYHTAMNAIAKARESFDQMSAEVRAKFQNDPQKFVEFCSNKDNLAEMRKMGLAMPEVVVDNVATSSVSTKEKSNASDSGKGTGESSASSEGSTGVGAGDKGKS